MKISSKNHKDSLEKWGDDSIIAQNIRDRKPYDFIGGWNACSVSESCGYCDEVGLSCYKCNLYPNICNSNVEEKESLFSNFIKCFLKRENNLWIIKYPPAFARAEKLRKRIYKAILADEKNVYEE